VANGKWNQTFGLIRAGASGLLGKSLPSELRYPERMALRHRGRTLEPGELARCYDAKGARSDIVLFVHGLMYDETCWESVRFNMAAALEDALGLFPVHLRYDTGLHVSENGRVLARLLNDLFQALPGFAQRLHVVAHSMGGLVTRSALYQAEIEGLAFTRLVDRVFLLAVPHRGAPLEKGVQALQLALEAAPGTLRLTAAGLRILFDNLRVGDRASLAPVADITDFYVHTLPAFYIKLASQLLPLRSEGILDLRHGYMLREEWEGPPEWGGLRPRKLPVPPLPGARYYAVAGSLSRNPPAAPSVRVLDGMVSTASAANAGPDDELRFRENGRYRLLPGVNHFVMPMDARVFEVLAGWFADAAPVTGPPG